MFFDKLFTVLPKDSLLTFAMCVLASVCVAIVMRFFIKTCLVVLDKYIEKKHPSDKVMAIYKTVKAVAYFLIAGILVGYALSKLMSVCYFPADNNRALAMFYFIPMYALQWFLDAHMKKIACKMFGLEYDGDEGSSPIIKEAKPKVFTKKVKYTVDDEGNEIPVEQ